MAPPKDTNETFFDHASAQRVDTSAVISRALSNEYPELSLLMVPKQTCDLLVYADSTGQASYEPLHAQKNTSSRSPISPSSLSITTYTPAAHRTEEGRLVERQVIGSYTYKWSGQTFVVYFVEGRDGESSYPQIPLYYVLHKEKAEAERLAFEVGKWSTSLHEEVWVFDQGYWQKSGQLYDSIRHASWDDVILDEGMKKTLIEDHLSFFASKERYAEFKVPWKRGIIYHGPPGNGKTISIKAMMHALYQLADPVPTLYVRSFSSGAGPEYSIKQIFNLARQMAPCYLIFEDLDSIVTDYVRSYFLNEVDGLKSNDGILMVGSTNHLDRLDPGISKRPSRFDRKYLFPDPNGEQREAYCHFWQRKLLPNKDVAFPDVLCPAIAGITEKFSFAYMQEAFVATLLAIARQSTQDSMECDRDWVVVKEDTRKDDLDKYILWREMQKQVKALRDAF